MCESTLYLEENGSAKAVMQDVARIVMEGKSAVCTNVVGERLVFDNVRLKEANFLSHGIVLTRD
ncbi:MAG: CooT family nickel-binding protein [Methanomassiliicoccales archaeon]|nr:CooT family nickel-binding protein [Methanomassiliicoccales archaeon]